MKNIYAIIAILIFTIVSAQVPQGISYQAIALNASGNPVINSNVGIRLSILDNSIAGNVLYTETHVKTTNAQGLFNLTIGQGTIVSGTFGTIDWRVNSKFIKVEMDTTGGGNYILAGTTQLLSVPYALAADSLVTSPGEGITLVSPNGTPYQITVNDSGQLSLPTSGSVSTVPSILYMYGSFNSFNAAGALLMSIDNHNGPVSKYGYKYLTAGTQLKFLSNNNAGATVYGVDAGMEMAVNGGAYTIPSDGFYYLRFYDANDNATNTLADWSFYADSISPALLLMSGGTVSPTYNSSTNVFSFIVNGIVNDGNAFTFYYENHRLVELGDNLADGTLDYNAPAISFPGVTATPKNYRVDLTINFGGGATYTITQL